MKKKSKQRIMLFLSIIFLSIFAVMPAQAPLLITTSLTLGPVTATETIGNIHTLTAHVVSVFGTVAGETITLTVTSGPGSGHTTIARTDSFGRATFTYYYPGTTPATNSFIATGGGAISNIASVDWVAVPTNIPEFPMVALPVATILGIVFIISRIRK
jgi:hypothetical protein